MGAAAAAGSGSAGAAHGPAVDAVALLQAAEAALHEARTDVQQPVRVVAGAGIAGHLHQHVVPRWGGDTNFLPVIGATKTIPQLLEDTRVMLSDAWGPGCSPRGTPSGP